MPELLDLKGRNILCEIIKNPFRVSDLDIFLKDADCQPHIAWGIVCAAGPEAKYAVGEMVFFLQAVAHKLAMDDGIVHWFLDSSLVLATKPYNPKEIIYSKRKAQDASQRVEPVSAFPDFRSN